MVWWIWLLIGIFSPITVIIIICAIWTIITTIKKGDERLCCNDCKQLFTNTSFKYCPYCGKKLEHHIAFISYIERKHKEISELDEVQED